MTKSYGKMVEMADTVFKPEGYTRYKVIKSRYGDVVVGATYSMNFVIKYAQENVDVYIDKEGDSDE